MNDNKILLMMYLVHDTSGNLPLAHENIHLSLVGAICFSLNLTATPSTGHRARYNKWSLLGAQ